MPFHSIPDTQPISNRTSIPELEEFLEPAAPSRDIVSTRMHITSIPHSLAQPLNIMRRHTFGVRQYLGNTFRNGDFIDTEIWIRGNDSTPGEIDSLSRKISTEPALFSFQALDEAPHWLLTRLRRHTRQLGVDVHGNGELEELPVFHELCRRSAFGEPLFYQSVRKDDLCQFDGEIVFVGCTVLGHRGTDANRRDGYVLPDIFLGSTELWFQPQELTVLNAKSKNGKTVASREWI